MKLRTSILIISSVAFVACGGETEDDTPFPPASSTPQPTPIATPTPTSTPTSTPAPLTPTPTSAPTTTPTAAPSTPAPTPVPVVTPTAAPTPTATPPPTPSEPSSPSANVVIEESESGFCDVDGQIEDNNAGFTGSGFANTNNTLGSGISWSLEAESNGNYNLQWRFANAADENRSANIQVNENTQATVDFFGTGAWTSWSNSEQITVYLNEGNNILRLEADTDGGLPNIDNISVFGEGVKAAPCESPAPSPAPNPTNTPTPTPEPSPPSSSSSSSSGSSSTSSSSTSSSGGDPSAPLYAVSYYPSKGRVNSCSDASVSIEFNRTPILKSGGQIRIHEASGDIFDSVTANLKDDLYFSDLQTRTSGGISFNAEVLDVVFNTVVFHPEKHLEYGKTYYVTVDEDLITDSQGTAFSVNESNAWRFTVRAKAPTNSNTYTLAADGSGDYCSVESVLKAMPDSSSEKRTIHVKKGVYPGIVRMKDSNVHFMGEGMDVSVISNKNSAKMNSDREGFELSGSDITFENLTIFNTYLKDSNGQQAEALKIDNPSERIHLKNVHLRSHQDTLQVRGKSVYMEGGKISGSTDPVWGIGTFYCDGCELMTRRSSHAFVVARSTTGFAMVNCKMTKEESAVRNTLLAQYHRGREPGKIAFINCQMDDHIVGWKDPDGNDWYEYGNTDINTGEAVRYNGIQLSADSEVLEEASSAFNWLGWSPYR